MCILEDMREARIGGWVGERRIVVWKRWWKKQMRQRKGGNRIGYRRHVACVHGKDLEATVCYCVLYDMSDRELGNGS
jgi:hypothetical protein